MMFFKSVKCYSLDGQMFPENAKRHVSDFLPQQEATELFNDENLRLKKYSVDEIFKGHGHVLLFKKKDKILHLIKFKSEGDFHVYDVIDTGERIVFTTDELYYHIDTGDIYFCSNLGKLVGFVGTFKRKNYFVQPTVIGGRVIKHLFFNVDSDFIVVYRNEKNNVLNVSFNDTVIENNPSLFIEMYTNEADVYKKELETLTRASIRIIKNIAGME